MPTAEHLYSYLAPSAVLEEDGRAEVSLATSGGRTPHPHFFSGFLGAPRQTAQALLVVAEVARTRYYEPPNMVAARILAADPVVTCESSTGCASSRSRPAPASTRGSTSSPALLDGAAATWGTTNVDFNPPMRAALARRARRRRDADARRPRRGRA